MSSSAATRIIQISLYEKSVACGRIFVLELESCHGFPVLDVHWHLLGNVVVSNLDIVRHHEGIPLETFGTLVFLVLKLFLPL